MQLLARSDAFALHCAERIGQRRARVDLFAIPFECLRACDDQRRLDVVEPGMSPRGPEIHTWPTPLAIANSTSGLA